MGYSTLTVLAPHRHLPDFRSPYRGVILLSYETYQGYHSNRRNYECLIWVKIEETALQWTLTLTLTPNMMTEHTHTHTPLYVAQGHNHKSIPSSLHPFFTLWVFIFWHFFGHMFKSNSWAIISCVHMVPVINTRTVFIKLVCVFVASQWVCLSDVHWCPVWWSSVSCRCWFSSQNKRLSSASNVRGN